MTLATPPAATAGLNTGGSLGDLLLPLAGASPSGADLLHEPEFDAIAMARHEDDATLPRGVWTAELKRADWPQVERLCREVLATRSKDLQVAAWLGEAWIARDGAEGGVRATELAAQLCERFWDTLHPLPRGADIEFRTAPLLWLDEHWSRALLLRVPLARGGGADAVEVTLAQWREALAFDNSERKDKKAAAKGAAAAPPGRIQLMAQVRSAPWEDMQATLAALGGWAAGLERLQGVLRERLGGEAPPLHHLRDLVGDARAVVEGWIGERPGQAAALVSTLPTVAADTPRDEKREGAAAGAPGPVVDAAAAIAGRADAYARLRQVADYLAQLEPHSPVPFLLRRAVDWGGMSFDKLARELTHNNNEMQKVLLRDPIE